MATETKAKPVKVQLDDILTDISWAKLSRRYFDKSSSWMYHKLDGINGGFSDSERELLKEALLDFAQRIEDCADKI